MNVRIHDGVELFLYPVPVGPNMGDCEIPLELFDEFERARDAWQKAQAKLEAEFNKISGEH